MKDFFSKCDQNRSFLRIWSHLLKKSFMENFFCAVYEPITILPARSVFTFQIKLFVVSIYYHIFKSFHTTSLLLYGLKMLMFSGGIKREKWHERG